MADNSEDFDADKALEEGMRIIEAGRGSCAALTLWLLKQPDKEAGVSAIIAMATMLLSKCPSQELRDRTLLNANMLLDIYFNVKPVDDGGAGERLMQATGLTDENQNARLKQITEALIRKVAEEKGDSG